MESRSASAEGDRGALGTASPWGAGSAVQGATGSRGLTGHRLLQTAFCLALLGGCGSGAVTSPEERSAEAAQGASDGESAQSGSEAGGGAPAVGETSAGGAGDSSAGSDSGAESDSGASPASTDPDDRVDPDGGEAVRYSWGLPAGDTSPSGNEGSGYGVLLRCEDASAWVAGAWNGFNSPRNVLTYMAGARLCKGDESGARPFYARALSDYGLAGLRSNVNACEVYRSVASVLEQSERSSLVCDGGEEPPWRFGDGGFDNPLTPDVDESQVATPTPAPTPDTSESSVASPSSETPSGEQSSSSETPSEEPAPYSESPSQAQTSDPAASASSS